MSRRPSASLLLITALAAFVPSLCRAAAPKAPPIPAPLVSESGNNTLSGYNQPPQNILEVMRSAPPATPDLSPTMNAMLLVTLDDYPSMERVAAPFLRLAGVRVETGNHSKHDTEGGYGITACARSLQLVHIPDGAVTPIALPANACPSAPIWAADGKRFVFTNAVANAVELWVGDGTTGTIRQVPGIRLNPMFGSTVQWMPDQNSLVVKLVPEGMGPPPGISAVSNGPEIEEANGEKGQSSTYEVRDTLNNRHDEDLFDYYATTQIALVNATTSAITPLGKPGNYDDIDPAPDGQHILVSTIHKPYSYVTTYERFPHDFEVWNIVAQGAPDVHTVVARPLADRVPVRGVPLGPRAFSWRPTEPATLIWADALDGGDWNVTVPARDRIFTQKAPFTSPAVEFMRLEQRYAGVQWSEQAHVALLHDYDQNRHWRRTFIVDFDNPDAKPRRLLNHSYDDGYADPGTPVRRQLANGSWVIRQEGNSIYFRGTGASPEGDRPFLDRLDLQSRTSERLFRSDRDAFEQVLTVMDAGAHTFLTWHQSPNDPPNAFIRSLGDPISAVKGEAVFASSSVPITHLLDPSPEVRKIKKRLVKYKRADGLDLSFTLYTPPGYVEGMRVPTILYAYPRDYADATKAAQVKGSEATFTGLRKYQFLLLAGYAIIDNASFPVVGDPKRAYDTYLEQLVADAKAAVDEAVRLGVTDPDRVGVTGHSHGALMTVNLIAHSDLFRAGVATSGSYNKTLTPFGFQSERRSVWEAPDVYLKVSPFFSADKLKTPLLLVHGAEDANPGTTPLQSTLLFEAIRGNGGTTRLVVLPHEPHWYSARESNEQLVYEMIRWFDMYVKNAPPRAVSADH